MDAAASGRTRVRGEVVAFGKLFAALTTLKRRDRVSEYDVAVYEDRLADVPLPILARAISRWLDTEPWFPTVQELRAACEAARCEIRGELQYVPCVECADSPGYRSVGKMAVERCPCWHAHQAKVKALELPDAPLALLERGRGDDE